MNKWTIILVPLALTLVACGSQSQRPAPVTENTVGTEPKTEEAKTFGYVDSGFSTVTATPGAVSQQPASFNTEPARITEQAPPGQASSNTVLALLQTAEGQERAGNLGGSAATLERALRIQPRNAVLWHQLANVRYQQGQYARASSLAGKSNSLAGGDSGLRRNNMLLIAKVKRAQGDEYGAREAEMKASGGGY